MAFFIELWVDRETRYFFGLSEIWLLVGLNRSWLKWNRLTRKYTNMCIRSVLCLYIFEVTGRKKSVQRMQFPKRGGPIYVRCKQTEEFDWLS